MNEDYLKELRNSAEDAEIVDDMSSVETAAGVIHYAKVPSMNKFLKRKFLEYSQIEKINSIKHGSNPKAVKARRKRIKTRKLIENEKFIY